MGEDKTIEFQGISHIEPSQSIDSEGVRVYEFLSNLGFSRSNDDLVYTYYNERHKFGINVLYVPRLYILSIDEFFVREGEENFEVPLLYKWKLKLMSDLVLIFDRINSLYFAFQVANQYS